MRDTKKFLLPSPLLEADAKRRRCKRKDTALSLGSHSLHYEKGFLLFPYRLTGSARRGQKPIYQSHLYGEHRTREICPLLASDRSPNNLKAASMPFADAMYNSDVRCVKVNSTFLSTLVRYWPRVRFLPQPLKPEGWGMNNQQWKKELRRHLFIRDQLSVVKGRLARPIHPCPIHASLGRRAGDRAR